MPVVKSFAVGNGDMFYIKHGSDNFTMIDCCLSEDNAEVILGELKSESTGKSIRRFISTHPDDDHFWGLEQIDAVLPILNFYVVKNDAAKGNESPSWDKYCELRDHNDKAFYIFKGCKRRWMNNSDQERGSAGIEVLWPDLNNEHFKAALKTVNDSGTGVNNISAVVRYAIENGPSFMWLGDLETDFMVKIQDEVALEKTTVVFASHHGRVSGKIPDSWLRKLDPQVIIIGEAPSRHLHYYTGYGKITQNTAGDIAMECVDDDIHFYASNKYDCPKLKMRPGIAAEPSFPGLTYIGSLTVEKEYTLDG
jgi:beta-lactamase superfamily II metal-dependent hydrolase